MSVPENNKCVHRTWTSPLPAKITAAYLWGHAKVKCYLRMCIVVKKQLYKNLEELNQHKPKLERENHKALNQHTP